MITNLSPPSILVVRTIRHLLSTLDADQRGAALELVLEFETDPNGKGAEPTLPPEPDVPPPFAEEPEPAARKYTKPAAPKRRMRRPQRPAQRYPALDNQTIYGLRKGKYGPRHGVSHVLPNKNRIFWVSESGVLVYAKDSKDGVYYSQGRVIPVSDLGIYAGKMINRTLRTNTKQWIRGLVNKAERSNIAPATIATKWGVNTGALHYYLHSSEAPTLGSLTRIANAEGFTLKDLLIYLSIPSKKKGQTWIVSKKG